MTVNICILCLSIEQIQISDDDNHRLYSLGTKSLRQLPSSGLSNIYQFSKSQNEMSLQIADKVSRFVYYFDRFKDMVIHENLKMINAKLNRKGVKKCIHSIPTSSQNAFVLI